MEDFARVVARGQGLVPGDTKDEDWVVPRNKVLESHLYRIEKMENVTAKTYDALNHLLDLKQKQANLTEAFFSRQYAQNTSHQVELATGFAERGTNLAEATAKQAEETAKQGKTVILFTVVTIIFLPLSFVAAFFTLNLDSFPVNTEGKLRTSYVLTYLFSISSAVSIPFIFIAFNQDRIAAWARTLVSTLVSRRFTLLFVLAAVIPLLAVIWTRDLASGIKVVITIVLVLVIVLGDIAQLIPKLVHVIARRSDDASSGTRSQSLEYD